MLGTEEPWERFANIRLVHSVRQASELTYRDRIETFAERAPGRFGYVPMVSREVCAGALCARIPATIEDGRLEDLASLAIEPEHAQVMICGNPDMVGDTQAVLKGRGLRRNRRSQPGQITVENYW
jgi:ferredoxin--NADP+ reductase